jgi:SAM-dependent methyltransferase
MPGDRRSGNDSERLRSTRAFFAERAAGWDAKFGDDMPVYAAAVARAGYAPGATVADIGCGTGRALPALRDQVGPTGTVLAIEVTPEMLAMVRTSGRAAVAHLLLGDALRLPIRDGRLDGVFAAGLLNHLPDPTAGLVELARATGPEGRLVLFHPTGRRALAARHGREVTDDEPLSRGPLQAALTAGAWELLEYEDGSDCFFVLARRLAR